MNGTIRSLSLTIVLVALLGAAPAFGWGQDGHRITAEIAARNINDHTESAIKGIIGDESLAEIATWPDDIRSDKRWDFAKPWHFLSIDDNESFKTVKPAPAGDVLQKLRDLEGFLKDPTARPVEIDGQKIDRRQALAFYVHLVGDIHQPLHVGRRDDQGGNKILVEWFDDEVNLHSVWDERLIESTNLSFTEFSSFLNRVADDEKTSWQNTDYPDWAMESQAVRGQVYDFGEQKESYYLNVRPTAGPPVLSYEYRSRSLPIIRERLKKGGIRLAGKLDAIFAGQSVPGASRQAAREVP